MKSCEINLTQSITQYNPIILDFSKRSDTVKFEYGVLENPEKYPRSRDETQQQTQPTCDARSRNRTRATVGVGECSHNCAIPAPTYCEKISTLQNRKCERKYAESLIHMECRKREERTFFGSSVFRRKKRSDWKEAGRGEKDLAPTRRAEKRMVTSEMVKGGSGHSGVVGGAANSALHSPLLSYRFLFAPSSTRGQCHAVMLTIIRNNNNLYSYDFRRLATWLLCKPK